MVRLLIEGQVHIDDDYKNDEDGADDEMIHYVAEARDWTNLKIPKAEADCSTKTPPRIEITC